MDPSITLERFAEIQAEIDAGAEREDVLRRARISAEAWDEAEEGWPRRIAHDAVRTGELKRRYRTAFEMKKLEMTTLKEAPPPSSGPDAIAFRAYAAAGIEQPTDVDPNWAQALDGAPTIYEDESASMIVPPEAPDSKVLKAEVSLDLGSMASIESSSSTGITLVHDSADLGVPPIADEESSTESDPRARTRVLRRVVVQDPLPWKRDPEVRSTRTTDLPPGVPSALPFRSPEPVVAMPANVPVIALDQDSMRARGTFEVPVLPDSQQQPSSQPTTRLTIEQYASLSAEIAAVPAATAELRQRYGLDESTHHAEQAEWQRRFVVDSGLYAHYAHLFQTYRDYLSGGGDG